MPRESTAILSDTYWYGFHVQWGNSIKKFLESRRCVLAELREAGSLRYSVDLNFFFQEKLLQMSCNLTKSEYEWGNGTVNDWVVKNYGIPHNKHDSFEVNYLSCRNREYTSRRLAVEMIKLVNVKYFSTETSDLNDSETCLIFTGCHHT